jgi:hypothetical protein
MCAHIEQADKEVVCQRTTAAVADPISVVAVPSHTDEEVP